MTETAEPARGARLTLAEVAEACGVSLSTVKRRQGQFSHAYKDRHGVWRVPVSDLASAGLRLRSGSVVEAADPLTEDRDLAVDPGELVDARGRIEALTEQLTAERIARAAAEATVAAYRDNLQDLRRQVNAITGPPAAPESVPAAAPVPMAPPEPRRATEPQARRRWPWSRS